MKKFNILFILICFLLIPSTVSAASQEYAEIATRNFSSADADTVYYIGQSNPYKPNNGSFAYTYFHQITDGGTKYLSYCLDDGFHSPYAGSGTITGSSSELVNKYGNRLSAANLQLLKNILAAGEQYVGDVDTYVQTVSTQRKLRYLATQVLVWEVMNGTRTDYVPANVHSPSPHTYDFVKTDSNLRTQYEKILSDASKLADGNKPAVFGKTLTLHWSDGLNRYVLNDSYNIGSYEIDSYDRNQITVAKDSNNMLSITTTKIITTPTTVNFKYLQGSTANTGDQLKWFVFNDTSQQNQRMLLAYYQGSNTGNLAVKTEQGSFKITKKDSNTKQNLKGSVFELDKCNSGMQCSKVATIDMKNKEVSNDISINKSGYYKLREVQAPVGYEKMPDLMLLLTIANDGKISVSYTGNYPIEKISASDTSILNLIVYDEAKYFNIDKVDGVSNAKVKGATFQIKKANGEVVKFKKEAEGKYIYDVNGTETNLVSANLSNYAIKLLPQGEYILEEIAVPEPYVMSSRVAERQTKFKIDKNDFLQTYNYATNKYVKDTDLTITVKNFKSRITIIKTGLKSAPVAGVTFELYDSNKQNQIPLLVANSNGEYKYSPNGQPVQLDTNSQGKLFIDSLPEGVYYLKEVRTPASSGLAIDENNQWTKLQIVINRSNATPYNYSKEIRNAKGSFCFYKIDENGNFLDKGKFKLQYYNKTTFKYEDVSLIYNSDDRTFTIDKTKKSDIYVFSPVSGRQTCFVDIDAKGKYKIIELEAPEGFVLPSASEAQAELEINEYGYATGDAVIMNKHVTIGKGAEAQAELIVNIQTGQTVIKYSLIIVVLSGIIGALLFLKKKIDKK